VRVVGRQRGGGCSYDRTDLLGGGHV
jgi:hypothetical protein